eukprot:gnl/MRDRNA2_/MRDRNA2_159425_c0_seq1.p1 gnl/MRDRNA2_/MRDRNA2_159425_c0~~gnl/MRDRNA2_/MRDRNA2_159425_c0_seq1.p1  ORF type:complete len:918 (+),score=188.69 gnl/MRDRNA2_/MRDRNA2_159425_c0_seq1:40-2754(+)
MATKLEEVTTPTLTDLDLRVRQGELCCVVGPIGSGKSSLLAGFLSELTVDPVDPSKSFGYAIKGRIAYVAQQAWIQNLTVRDNILFGKPFKEDMYWRIIDACALRRDLEIFPAGDQTEIGERGINLSGGQKQRIAIARAVYQDADVYFLDDPLSAVDPEVGNTIFHDCVQTLLGSKTRILATHGLNFLPHADRVVCMEKGRIMETGTYAELIHAGEAFQRLMKSHGVKESSTSVPEGEKTNEEKGLQNGKPKVQNDAVAHSLRKTITPGHSITVQERKEEGAVASSVYMNYFKFAGGKPVIMLLVFGYVGCQVVALVSEWWMTRWAEDVFDQDWSWYAAIYAGFIFCSVLMVAMRSAIINVKGLKAAKVMHGGMLSQILQAKMAFFDANPTGRVLNRFSRDLEMIDSQLVTQMDTAFSISLVVVGSLVASCVISPLFVIAFIPVLYLFNRGFQFYRPSARDASRLESIHNSPLVSHFSETLSGASTIRGFQMEQHFVDHNLRCCNHAHRPKFIGLALRRWMDLRLEMVNSAAVMALAGSILALRDFLGVHTSPGLAGMAIKQVLGNVMFMGWALMNLTMLETNMSAAERIAEYSGDGIPVEATRRAGKMESDWPREGKIEVDNLSVAYKQEDGPVLKGLQAIISAKETIGVVGRTGSGKSSLMLALFRILEATTGQIKIDKEQVEGEAISEMGLHDLRSKLAIIPQEPVLFSGTVRTNLDPFSEVTDDAIWEVLDIVQLQVAIKEKGGLEAKVMEYGENFSQGERQVMCLARALLRKPKVLVLDEATASVDWDTDRLIQETVRSRFEDSTVLVIAHRLSTIIESHKVMVLDRGELVEFAPPAELLQNNNSYFSKMVAEYGESVAAQLRERAVERKAELQNANPQKPVAPMATPGEQPAEKIAAG